MKLSELIKDLQILKDEHGDMTVVYTRMSDYGVLEPDDYGIKKASPVKGAAGEWMMRYYGGSSIPVETEEVLHFEGN